MRAASHDRLSRAAATAACGTRTRTCGAVAGLALNRQRAVDFPQDRAADRQAEAVAVRLGREERLEHPRQILRRECRSRCRRSRSRPRDRSDRTVTVIRPPCGVASRALVSRLRNTCSRSLWLQATSGISSGMLTCSSIALRLMPYFRIADAVSMARRTCPYRLRRAALRENVSIPPKIRRHTWSDFCTCSRSSANTVGAEHAAAQVRLHLLDQRQHRPERVVHVVRHAPRQIGHRVLALRGHDAGAERLGAMQVLDGDRGLRSKVLDQLGVERLELFRVARRDLQDADQAVPRDQRRTQHRRFPNVLAVRAVAGVVVEQRRQPGRRLAFPLPPRCRRADRSRRPVPTAAAPRHRR